MFKHEKQNTIDAQKQIKIVGLYQIIGGLIGLIMIIITSFSTPSDNLPYLIIPGLLLFGFSIYVGKQTYMQRKNYLNLTIINQILQIVGVYIDSFGFEYVSGLGLYFTVDMTNQLLIGVNTNLSKLNYSLNYSHEKYFFSFNIIAVLIIYYLEKMRSSLKTSNRINEHNA
jgi:hypothetical protein